jgi:basic membrane protein A and related proteins
MKAIKLGAVIAAAGILLAACGSDSNDNNGASATTAAGGTGTTAAGGTGTTAAGGTGTSAAASGDCASPDFFCIGLVTDVGKVDDKSFNQSAWEGAQNAAKTLGGKAEYIETKDPKDYGTNIQQFVDKKYDAIITVGFALGEATTAAAQDNATTKFIGVDQFQSTAVTNLTGLIFNEDKAGFIAGALAGLMTKSNKIGAVLGTDKVPPVVAYKTGWENGAKYTNPKATFLSTFHPGGLDKAFLDPEWGATTAKQALDQGADIIFGAGGKTGNGALIEIAKKPGALCVGVDTDQWDTVPEAQPCLITSAMKLITPGVEKLLSQAKDGSIKGGNFVGDVGLAPFHDFESKVPADVKSKVDEITKGVLDGSIPTGYTPSS